MAFRGFGFQALGAASQPLISTTLSAAFAVTPDPHTGRTDPGSQASTVTAAVASSANFLNGDKIWVGPAAGPFDQGQVYGIPDATHIQIKGLTGPHASGEFVALGGNFSSIYVLAGGATIFLGSDHTVAVGSATLFRQLLTTTFWEVGASGSGNMYGTGSIWISGTTGAAAYLVSVDTI